MQIAARPLHRGSLRALRTHNLLKSVKTNRWDSRMICLRLQIIHPFPRLLVTLSVACARARRYRRRTELDWLEEESRLQKNTRKLRASCFVSSAVRLPAYLLLLLVCITHESSTIIRLGNQYYLKSQTTSSIFWA